MFEKIKKIIRDLKIKSPDPVKECETYKNEGCSFVDGIGCNFPNCPFQGGTKRNFGYDEIFK